MSEQTTISKPRRALLNFLCEHGGEIRAKGLPVPSRRLASQMASDGLVRWEPGRLKTKLDTWTLRITEHGLRAIGELK